MKNIKNTLKTLASLALLAPCVASAANYESLFFNSQALPLQGAGSQSYSGFFDDGASSDALAPSWAGSVTATATAVQSGTGFDSAAFFNGAAPLAVGSDTMSNFSVIYMPHTHELADGLINSYKIEYDFSGLINGYLPAGSVIWAYDVDSGPANTELVDFVGTVAGASTSAPGFSLLHNGSPSGNTAYSIAGSSLSVWNQGTVNLANEVLSWTTTQDFTSIAVSAEANRNNGSFRFGIAAPTVPEPSGAMLGLLASMLFAVRRRR